MSKVVLVGNSLKYLAKYTVFVQIFACLATQLLLIGIKHGIICYICISCMCSVPGRDINEPNNSSTNN
jgi:hypothetical protein